MEIKFEKTPKLFFQAEALDTLYSIANSAKDDIWVVGKLFYVENEAYCSEVDIPKQTIEYTSGKIDKDIFQQTIMEIEKDEDNTDWFNLLILCKGTSAASIYNTQEEQAKELLKDLYDDMYLMAVNKKKETELNYYNWESHFKITDMPVLVDVDGCSDVSLNEIEKTISKMVTKKSYYGGYYSGSSNSYSKTSRTYTPPKNRVPSKLAKEKPELKKLV